MSDSHLPRSPFVGMADLGGRRPIRVLSAEEIAEMLASHRRYRETEYHEGHRADFSSVDLTGRDFSGLDLRGIKMDHAALRGANFSGADLRGANLVGVIAEQARFDRVGSVPGTPQWRQSGFVELRERPPRQSRDGVRSDGQCGLAACLPE